MPYDPADLPRIGVPGRACAELAHGLDLRAGDEILVLSLGENERSVGHPLGVRGGNR